MKKIKLLESFLVEKTYAEKIKDFGTKINVIAQKKTDLNNKLRNLAGADTQKEAIKAEITRIQLQMIELERQRVNFSKRIEDLNQKLKNLR